MNERQRHALAWLRTADRDRELYETAAPGDPKRGSGIFHITYSDGTAPALTRAEVDELVAAGEIVKKPGYVQVYRIARR